VVHPSSRAEELVQGTEQLFNEDQERGDRVDVGGLVMLPSSLTDLSGVASPEATVRERLVVADFGQLPLDGQRE
jgi:hypothetical protein